MRTLARFTLLALAVSPFAAASPSAKPGDVRADAIIAAVESREPGARTRAREELIAAARAGDDVLPVLEAMAATGRFSPGWEAVNVAGEIADPRFLAFLVEEATRVHDDVDVDHHVRWRACWALHRIAVRTRSPDAESALMHVLESGTPARRHRAAVALGMFGTEAVRPVLEASLQSDDAFTRFEATFVLEHLARRACPAIDPPSSPSSFHSQGDTR
jgi:HEAT repeat protein